MIFLLCIYKHMYVLYIYNIYRLEYSVCCGLARFFFCWWINPKHHRIVSGQSRLGFFFECLRGMYPSVNWHNHGKKRIFMGKSTISAGPFSIAMLNYQRMSINKWSNIGVWISCQIDLCFCCCFSLGLWIHISNVPLETFKFSEMFFSP